MKMKTWQYIVLFLSLSMLSPFQKGPASPKNDVPSSSGNPAFTYCTQVMGYDYEIKTNADTSQDGFCILPDSEKCEQWDFYAGKCGEEHSWCAQNDAGLEIRRDGQDPYNHEYALCIDKQGRELGTIQALAELSLASRDLTLTFDSIETAVIKEDEIQRKGLVPSFDWRNFLDHNWMTPAKNQAQCGSCWAFATVALTEAQLKIIANNPYLNPDLSEQYLVSDCFAEGSCNTGSDVKALMYIRDSGIPDEACYPYLAENSLCTDRCPDYASRLKKVPNAYYKVNYDGNEETNYTEVDIKSYLFRYGPITLTLGMDGNQYGGAFDNNGIYRCSNDFQDGVNVDPPIDHSVLAVGYNDEGGYWIVKNSWGASWGDDGYFKLGYDECNVMDGHINWTQSTQPVKEKIPVPKKVDITVYLPLTLK